MPVFSSYEMVLFDVTNSKWSIQCSGVCIFCLKVARAYGRWEWGGAAVSIDDLVIVTLPNTQAFRTHSTKVRLLKDYGQELITIATANTHSYHKGQLANGSLKMLLFTLSLFPPLFLPLFLTPLSPPLPFSVQFRWLCATMWRRWWNHRHTTAWEMVCTFTCLGHVTSCDFCVFSFNCRNTLPLWRQWQREMGPSLLSLSTPVPSSP